MAFSVKSVTFETEEKDEGRGRGGLEKVSKPINPFAILLLALKKDHRWLSQTLTRTFNQHSSACS